MPVIDVPNEKVVDAVAQLEKRGCVIRNISPLGPMAQLVHYDEPTKVEVRVTTPKEKR